MVPPGLVPRSHEAQKSAREALFQQREGSILSQVWIELSLHFNHSSPMTSYPEVIHAVYSILHRRIEGRKGNKVGVVLPSSDCRVTGKGLAAAPDTPGSNVMLHFDFFARFGTPWVGPRAATAVTS